MESMSAAPPEIPEAIRPGRALEASKKKRGCLTFLGAAVILAAVVLVIAGIAGYFYWQSVKTTPAYSLALIVEAARGNDREKISELLDTDQVINSFVPQITDKAVELYGKGLPTGTIAKVSQVAAPFIPQIKDRVKAELPRLIREKTQPVEKVPYWAITLFAERAVEIKQDGDVATVKSKIADRELELTMKRKGDLWQIVTVKDDRLARQIAEKIGQEIIGALTGLDKITKPGNLGDILKNVDQIFK